MPKLGKVRFSFFIIRQYKERIAAVLDEGRAVGALPMSCDDLSAFINESIGKELARVEAAIAAAQPASTDSPKAESGSPLERK